MHYAKHEHLKEVLIAEDDIHFSATGALNFYLKNRPIDYDIYLGGITWRKIKEDNTVNDFSGAVLYMVNENFYDILLALPEVKDFDRALAGKRKFIVSSLIVAVQHNGYSDTQKRTIDFEPYNRRRKLFGS